VTEVDLDHLCPYVLLFLKTQMQLLEQQGQEPCTTTERRIILDMGQVPSQQAEVIGVNQMGPPATELFSGPSQPLHRQSLESILQLQSHRQSSRVRVC
jgi:hypothetical protein